MPTLQPEKYEALVRCVNETEKWPADFRISETPVFLTREFTDEATRAANEIVAATRTPEFAKHAASAIPKDWKCRTNQRIRIFCWSISRFAPKETGWFPA